MAPGDALSPSLADTRDRLLGIVAAYESCAVALSGGVDSAVVAMAARLALGDNAVAITGVSPSLAASERDQARRVAAQVRIRHLELPTAEFQSPDYRRNEPDRCFHCKRELYTRMRAMADRLGLRELVNGANRDDLADFRPGMSAAAEYGVRSPLVDCGLTKSQVRALARDWGLAVWEKPASPCLSSRVAYGEEVTPQRVEMIERAEAYMRRLTHGDVRVRYHRGEVARIEVRPADIPRICEEATRKQLVTYFRELGFRFVTIDLEGFRSGSLNVFISEEQLLRPPAGEHARPLQ